MSGMLRTHGSLETSSQTMVYRVSVLAPGTSRYAAVGKVRMRTNCPMGARSGPAESTFVVCLRVMSMIASGKP